jgi:peptidylprolyl isomerase
VTFSIVSHNTKVLEAATSDYDNLVYIKLKDGLVVIELMPNIAPNNVARFKELVREKFYNGLKFHRVREGFMAQAGDPNGDGTGGSGKKITSEFSGVSHKRGIVSMARSSDPHSADSQFFIVLKDSPFLDGKYSVFGKVISGMEYVDHIKKGDSSDNGMVVNPDKITYMAIASDVEKAKAFGKSIS